MTDQHAFVLTSQAAIGKYSAALRDTSVIDSLNDRIAHTTNQATITMLKLGIEKELFAVQNTRGKISKKSMVHNGATPDIAVDPETYEVRADGELLTCAPAEVLPMAQRYFLF